MGAALSEKQRLIGHEIVCVLNLTVDNRSFFAVMLNEFLL